MSRGRGEYTFNYGVRDKAEFDTLAQPIYAYMDQNPNGSQAQVAALPGSNS